MPKKCRSGKGQGRFKKRVRIDTDSPLAEDQFEKNDSDEPLTLGPGFVHFSGDVYLHTSRRPVTCWTKRHIFDLTFQLYGADRVHYPFKDCDERGQYTKGCVVEKLRSQIAVRRYLERAGELKNLTETQIEELEERWNAVVAESKGLAMAKAKGIRISQRSADVEEFNETNANNAKTTESVVAATETKPKKRQLSPYINFCKKTRSKVVTENPDLTFGRVGRKLGEMWRELGEEEKKKYAEEEEKEEVPEPEPTAEDAPKLSTTPPKRGPGRPKKKPRDALGRILRSTKGSSGFDDVIHADAEAEPPATPEACSVDCATLMAVVDWRSARMREEMRTMIEKASVDEMKQLAVIYGDALVRSTEITIEQAERVKALEADAVTVGEALEQAVAMKDEIGERVKVLEGDLASTAAVGNKRAKELNEALDLMKAERDSMKDERDSMKDEIVKLARALAADLPLFKDDVLEWRKHAHDTASHPVAVLWAYKRELVRMVQIKKAGKDMAKAELKKVKAELKKVRAWGIECARVAKERTALQANVASIKAQRDKLRKREKYLEAGHNNTTQRFLAAAAERDAMKAERDEAVKLAKRLQDRLRQSEVPEEVPEVPTASPDSRKRKRASPSVSPAVGVKLEPDFDGTERRGRSILRRILPSWNFTKQG